MASDNKKTLNLLDFGIIMDIPKDYSVLFRVLSQIVLRSFFCNFYNK